MKLESKSILENELSMLVQQANTTRENWNDTVQRRFYNEFVDQFTVSYNEFLHALAQLEREFEVARVSINNLSNTNYD